MDPATGILVGSGINAGANVLGNILNWISGSSTNASNLEIMREQNKWAYQMWQRNNEYNSPQAQMARLRAAGINPALAYSNGMQNTSSAVAETADSPSMRPTQFTPFQMDPSLFGQAEVQRAQADLFRAQAADLLGETPEAKARIAEHQKMLDKLQSEVDLNSQKIQESVAQIGLLGEQGKTEVRKRLHLDFEEKMRSDEFERDSAHVAALIRNLDAQSSKYRADAAYINQQVEIMAERAVYEILGLQLDNDLKQQSFDKGELEIEQVAIDIAKGNLSLEDAVLKLNEQKYFANLKDQDPLYRGLNALVNLIRIGLTASASSVSK